MEPGLGDLREVMVLVVVAHIVCEAVEGSIIGVCLLALHRYQTT